MIGRADDFTKDIPDALFLPYFDDQGSHVYHTNAIGDCFRLYDKVLDGHRNVSFVNISLLEKILEKNTFEEICRKIQK